MSGRAGTQALREGGAGKRDLAARLRLGPGAELAVARAHSSRMRSDQSGVKRPARAHGQQDLAQHRRVEHAGVEDDLHPSSRKNSAFR